MRIVVDTNVFINAFIAGDKWARRLLEEQAEGHIEFLMSEETARELALTIIKVFEEKNMTVAQLKPILILLCKCLLGTTKIEPQKHFDACKHKADNKFIDCAVAGNCKYIISYNEHLLELDGFTPTGKKKDSIRILSPYLFILELNQLKVKAK